MRGGQQRHFTYANVMSTIAVLLVVAGGATAIAAVVLAKNSVKSRHIARGAVKTSDLGRNAATGAKVREASLAQVPSAGQANNAATATNAANAGTIDGIDSLGLARPAGVAGDFSPTDALTLELAGYASLAISCTDVAGDSGDAIAFNYQSNMGSNAIHTVTVALASAESTPAAVEILGGVANSGAQTDSNNVGSIVYRVQQSGGSKGVAIFAQGHEKIGSSDCEGSIQAFRIG